MKKQLPNATMKSSRGSRTAAAALEVPTADTLRPSVHLFFDSITAEQWTLITQGSPDDTTKMLLADLILEMISSVTSAISTAVEDDPGAKDSLVSGLDQSLRKSLTEVLHIPDHADDVSIRCVTDMMTEEVKEGLEAFFSGSPQKITTLCSLNSMILVVTGVMKKFSKRVKKVFKPRKAERRKEPPAEAGDLEPELQQPASGSSLSKELEDIVSPILDIVPDPEYQGVFSRTATEIQALSEDIGTLLDGTRAKKNPLKGQEEPASEAAEPKGEKDLESIRAFVHFVIEKVLNHIHYEAKVVPQYNDQVLQAVLARIWPRVWDESAHLCLTENSFKKMDRTIHRVICEKLGDPNKVLFMLLHSDESTIEDCTVHIARKLLRPSRKANIWRRLCCFLARAPGLSSMLAPGANMTPDP